MNEVLRNFISNLTTIDDYTQIVIFCAVVAALWLLRAMTGSTARTVIFSPAILFGALAANYLFRVNFVNISNDKDTNVVVASAVGVLFALILMLLASRIAIFMAERKTHSRINQLLLPSAASLGTEPKQT